MKVFTVVGARPQFVKAAAISRVLRQKHTEVLLHTGQHYDDKMSEVFFRELGIPVPNINLRSGSGSHAEQTAVMLAGIEKALVNEKPDCVLVYGDTNSTLAAALAAAKLNIPVAHVEAGLRSYNRAMPEEINRVLTDHVSTVLLCPSSLSMENLRKEGVTAGVRVVGDVMFDALTFAAAKAKHLSPILSCLGLKEKDFLLVTVHRAENTDNVDRLSGILKALCALAEKESVVFAVHPRTRKKLNSMRPGFFSPGLKFIEPVGYLDMVRLEEAARLILTDSGGVQKEAYWLKTPCVTLRNETEWVETLENGWNRLAGADSKAILRSVAASSMVGRYKRLYLHNGHPAENCVIALERAFGHIRLSCRSGGKMLK